MELSIFQCHARSLDYACGYCSPSGCSAAMMYSVKDRCAAKPALECEKHRILRGAQLATTRQLGSLRPTNFMRKHVDTLASRTAALYRVLEVQVPVTTFSQVVSRYLKRCQHVPSVVAYDTLTRVIVLTARFIGASAVGLYARAKSHLT